jgi:tetratricopeptide (TPR) repeat protein
MMDRALATEDRDPETLNAFAWTLAERGLEPETAVELAMEAHMLAPDDMNIVDTLAEALYSAGRYDQAVTWEGEALRREPGNEWFRQQLEKFQDALDSLERAPVPIL